MRVGDRYLADEISADISRSQPIDWFDRLQKSQFFSKVRLVFPAICQQNQTGRVKVLLYRLKKSPCVVTIPTSNDLVIKMGSGAQLTGL